MPRPVEDALPPLLALTQCAALIHHLAATGMVDGGGAAHVVDCLYGRASPGDGADEGRYAIGGAVLRDLLLGELPDNQGGVEPMMHALAGLERKLARHPAILAHLRERLGRARTRQEGFAMTPAGEHAVLAGIYTETLGGLRQALSVTGSLRQISDPRNADLIRTLILGGVQAAAVWRRMGGRRWRLRFQRRKLLKALEALSGQAP